MLRAAPRRLTILGSQGATVNTAKPYAAAFRPIRSGATPRRSSTRLSSGKLNDIVVPITVELDMIAIMASQLAGRVKEITGG
jgi:hypothetical protein